MIYPTRRAVLISAALAPLALAVGVALPHLWVGGLALLIFLIALGIADALLGAGATDIKVDWTVPTAVGVGEPFELTVRLRKRAAAPRLAEVAIDGSPLLDTPRGYRRTLALGSGETEVAFDLVPRRRGSALLRRVWVRWPGPLGLVWKQKRVEQERMIVVTPDVRPVRQKSAQLLHRDTMHGVAAQKQIGEGSEFESLAEYRTGMDRRSIDWKQSARHTALLAKEYRTERNNQIVLAIDAGRSMGDPLAGVPRVDRAISAGLLMAFVALKEGDRVSLFGFDSKPRVATNAVSGSQSFALLQQVAAQIDYSPNETNYTLALSTLGARLQRRSLIVVFTDFTDTISAELMLNALKPLLKRHLILLIVMRDEELEEIAGVEPVESQDVVRAVTANGLLRQRELVLSKLRHLGAHVLETHHETAGPDIVQSYLRMKRRSLL